MSAPRKRWDDHSPKWQRQATREGLTRARWDAWFNLSPASRKVTNPREYAKGITVTAQRRRAQEDAAADVMGQLRASASDTTIRKGVAIMTARQLRWTIKAKPHQIRKRAAMPAGAFGLPRNPWWYN